jgi:hypothetical protein
MNRIQTILKSIQSCGENGADKEKIISMIGLEMGAARRTALEYLSNLIVMRKITEKDGIYYDRKPEIQKGSEERVEDREGDA